jgi:DNA-binding SARP family transcriptional activator/Tfp pilus assembly protein PilF
LAALMVDAGRILTLETLVDRVWGGSPPPGARPTLYAHISRLRQMLARVGGEARLVHRLGGYVLEVDLDRIDLHRFRRLVAQARTHPAGAAEPLALLREAVTLWRGEPLAGLAGEWAARMRAIWGREQLEALVAWARAELKIGKPTAVLGPLSDLAGRYPLVESVTAVLMRALCAAGRAAEALDQFAITRRRLADELGTDPGPELQALYQAILHGHLGPAEAGVPRPNPPDAAVVPAQLPADVHGFTGRTDLLRRLDDLLAPAGRNAQAVVIAALCGTAGVGKTALAIHWAHWVADKFPDGQLYVDLHGFDAHGDSLSPAEAVRAFLDALGVASARIPPDLDAQAALYRSLVAGRRMLVVLDNARHADQVRPLLPGTPTALVVTTSRDQLTSLVAADGAIPFTVDLLTTDEARDLLVHRLGADQVAAEPGATREIITACARLPLALNIATARAQQTGFPLAALAAELSKADQRLDRLDAGDAATDMRAVFSWSYCTLTAAAARLFRLLSLHPGPDVSTRAVVSLARQPHSVARRLLTDLTRTNLLTEHTPGRYGFHDLLRVYATDLSRAHDPDRTAALTRLLDHFVHTAHAAIRLLDPTRDPIPVPLGQPAFGSHPEHPADRDQAIAWLAVECPVLTAAVDSAASGGYARHAWQLAWTLHTFLERQGHWHELVAAWQTALDAAAQLPELLAQAHAHRFLAGAETLLGRYTAAHAHCQQALDIYIRQHDLAGQAHTHHRLATLRQTQNHPGEALDHAQRALALFQAVGHHGGQADALNAIGWCHAHFGDPAQALICCRQALALVQQTGDHYGQANTWDSLGHTHHRLRHHAKATRCYQRALVLFRDLGARYKEASTLVRLGDAHHTAGHSAVARNTWQQSLDILIELDHPDAEIVRAKLHDRIVGADQAR